MLNLRRLNEFFQREGHGAERTDDLRAYHFPGFNDVGGFLSDADYRDIHKRIGHMTLQHVREGHVSWLMHNAVASAVSKAVAFLDYLINNFYSGDSQRAALPLAARGAMSRLLVEMDSVRRAEEQA